MLPPSEWATMETGRQLLLMDELREVVDVVRHRVVAGRRPRGIAVAAQVGGDDVVLVAQRWRRPSPSCGNGRGRRAAGSAAVRRDCPSRRNAGAAVGRSRCARWDRRFPGSSLPNGYCHCELRSGRSASLLDASAGDHDPGRMPHIFRRWLLASSRGRNNGAAQAGRSRATACSTRRRSEPIRPTPASRRSRNASVAASSSLAVAQPEQQRRGIDRRQDRALGVPAEIRRAVAGGVPDRIDRARRAGARPAAHCVGSASTASGAAHRLLVRAVLRQPQRDHRAHPLGAARIAARSERGGCRLHPPVGQSQNASIMSAAPPGNSSSASSAGAPMSARPHAQRAAGPAVERHVRQHRLDRRVALGAAFGRGDHRLVLLRGGGARPVPR